MKQFSKYFDHTLLKPDASRSDILKLCGEAAKYDFASVCVNGCHVAAAGSLTLLFKLHKPDTLKYHRLR